MPQSRAPPGTCQLADRIQAKQQWGDMFNKGSGCSGGGWQGERGRVFFVIKWQSIFFPTFLAFLFIQSILITVLLERGFKCEPTRKQGKPVNNEITSCNYFWTPFLYRDLCGNVQNKSEEAHSLIGPSFLVLFQWSQVAAAVSAAERFWDSKAVESSWGWARGCECCFISEEWSWRQLKLNKWNSTKSCALLCPWLHYFQPHSSHSLFSKCSSVTVAPGTWGPLTPVPLVGTQWGIRNSHFGVLGLGSTPVPNWVRKGCLYNFPLWWHKRLVH